MYLETQKTQRENKFKIVDDRVKCENKNKKNKNKINSKDLTIDI